jgi:hypothetical protein
VKAAHRTKEADERSLRCSSTEGGAANNNGLGGLVRRPQPSELIARNVAILVFAASASARNARSSGSSVAWPSRLSTSLAEEGIRVATALPRLACIVGRREEKTKTKERRAVELWPVKREEWEKETKKKRRKRKRKRKEKRKKR